VAGTPATREPDSLLLAARTASNPMCLGYTISIVAILINYRKVSGWST
jgi:hypothetical protein